MSCLPQLPRQILCFQVRIPPQHAQIFVPRDGGYFHDVEAEFEKARCSFMPQIMEMEVFNPCPAYGTDIGAFDGLGGEAWKYLAMDAARE